MTRRPRAPPSFSKHFLFLLAFWQHFWALGVCLVGDPTRPCPSFAIPAGATRPSVLTFSASTKPQRHENRGRYSDPPSHLATPRTRRVLWEGDSIYLSGCFALTNQGYSDQPATGWMMDDSLGVGRLCLGWRNIQKRTYMDSLDLTPETRFDALKLRFACLRQFGHSLCLLSAC